jgi:uncharacterized protein (TIGR00156 family)
MTLNNLFEEVYMKKYAIFGVCLMMMIVLSTVSVFGQGFTGPGAGRSSRQLQTVTVAQARNLPDNSLVILTGNIVQSQGRERYTFRDSTGDIAIEIDRDLWVLLDVSVAPGDPVEIRGEIDIEDRMTEIDVKYIKKLNLLQN